MRDGMETPFESWIGQPAIVRLALRHITVSLRATVLTEQTETLLVRDENGLDLQICKNTVLAIEEVGGRSVERHSPCLRQSCRTQVSSRPGAHLPGGTTIYVRVP
jgi:hypothetical protein